MCLPDSPSPFSFLGLKRGSTRHRDDLDGRVGDNDPLELDDDGGSRGTRRNGCPVCTSETGPERNSWTRTEGPRHFSPPLSTETLSPSRTRHSTVRRVRTDGGVPTPSYDDFGSGVRWDPSRTTVAVREVYKQGPLGRRVVPTNPVEGGWRGEGRTF